MDPFGANVDYGYYLFDNDECPRVEQQMPSTSTAQPSGPPEIDQAHMEWLETFGPINTFGPADLEDAANNVDWDSWSRYLQDEDIKNTPSPMPVKEDFDLRYLDFNQPQQQPIMQPSTSIKSEPDSLVVVKEEEDIKPNVSDMSYSISRSTTPGSVFDRKVALREGSLPYIAKPKRGRPKKVRVVEDQARMSLNERRKAMNRDAALRYREKKKAELELIKSEQDELVVRNEILREQERQLQEAIRSIKLQLNATMDFKFI